jgi:hypothetical protein
LYFEKPTIVYT